MMVSKMPKHSNNAFTLVELLVALVVTSIVLAAVATLAFAMGTANDISGDTSRKQAEVRFATLKISELLRHCKLICGTAGDDLAVWRVDENDNGRLNVDELVYIETGSNRDYIWIREFSGSSAFPAWFEAMSLQEQADVLRQDWFKNWLVQQYGNPPAKLIPQCSNVRFVPDAVTSQTQFISISFELEESGVWRDYQISAARRCSAENLLYSSSGDDD